MSTMLISFCMLLLTRHVAANCAYGTADHPRQMQIPMATFGYDGEDGPLNWFGLNESANKLCATGNSQSPVVLTNMVESIVPGSSIRVSLDHYPHGTTIENLGTTIEVPANGTLVDSTSKTFKLVQFHFHTPSEHRINGEHFPIETHFVFQAADKQITVLGVLVDVCEGSGCGEHVLESILRSVSDVSEPRTEGETGPINFDKLMNNVKSGNLYHYSGSLTTPPCSQNVVWLVSQHVSKVQLPLWQSLRRVLGYNARVSQNKPGDENLLREAGDELKETNNLSS